MIPSLQEALQGMNLSNKLVLVLGVLLASRRPMLVSAIARATKLNRTTTYDVLEELSDRGLVSRAKNDGATRYQSVAFELLPAYVERQRTALEETKKKLNEIIPQIALLRTHGKTLPKVQFFEGLEGVKQAYEDTLENNRDKKIYDITGTDAIYNKMGPEWLEYYWKKRSSLNIACTAIAPDTEWSIRMREDDEKYRRTIRLIPKEYSFNSEIDIYDNKVGIFSFAEDNPIAILIEDETVHNTMKVLFDYMLRHTT